MLNLCLYFVITTLYTNKQQNIKTFRHDWKLVDQNCPEYGLCAVYVELSLDLLHLHRVSG